MISGGSCWASRCGGFGSLDLRGCQPTSVTLGLAPVEKVLERLSRWRQQLPASRVKLKLGSPDGLSHDQALVEALLPVLGGAELQVDANGGWSLEGARQMLPWLAERGVVLVEQPLAASDGDEQGFAALQGQLRFPWWPMKAAGTSRICCGWRPTCRGSTSSCSKPVV